MILSLTFPLVKDDDLDLMPTSVQVEPDGLIPAAGDVITIRSRDCAVVGRKYHRRSDGTVELTGLILT